MLFTLHFVPFLPARKSTFFAILRNSGKFDSLSKIYRNAVFFHHFYHGLSHFIRNTRTNCFNDIVHWSESELQLILLKEKNIVVIHFFVFIQPLRTIPSKAPTTQVRFNFPLPSLCNRIPFHWVFNGLELCRASSHNLLVIEIFE